MSTKYIYYIIFTIPEKDIVEGGGGGDIPKNILLIGDP